MMIELLLSAGRQVAIVFVLDDLDADAAVHCLHFERGQNDDGYLIFVDAYTEKNGYIC